MSKCDTCKNYGGLKPQNVFDLFTYNHKCKLCINNPNLVSFYEES